jgi:hypothetical protein
MIRLRDASDGWVPDVSMYHIFAKKHITRATLALPPTRAAMMS